METQKLYFGKLPKVEDPQGRTLLMAKYTVNVPDPPDTFDNIALIEERLKITDVAKLLPMDGNDQYGDCVAAAKAHYITVANGRVGEVQIPTEQDVVDFYFKRSGGQDSGLVMLDTLKYLRKHPFFNHKFLGFGEINLHDHRLVKQCIWLFGGVDLGFVVQQDCISDFNAGRIWRPGPSTGGGHDVLATSYDKDTITLSTWGGLAKGGWDWWDAQSEESYAILPMEAKLPNFAYGFDYKALAADLKAVTKK